MGSGSFAFLAGCAFVSGLLFVTLRLSVDFTAGAFDFSVLGLAAGVSVGPGPDLRVAAELGAGAGLWP